MNVIIDSLVPLEKLSFYLTECRSKLSDLIDKLDLIIYFVILFLIFNLLLYYLIHKVNDENHKFRFLRRTNLPDKVTRTLLVTAHPGNISLNIDSEQNLKYSTLKLNLEFDVQIEFSMSIVNRR